jgi:hypothetical protein
MQVAVIIPSPFWEPELNMDVLDILIPSLNTCPIVRKFRPNIRPQSKTAHQLYRKQFYALFESVLGVNNNRGIVTSSFTTSEPRWLLLAEYVKGYGVVATLLTLKMIWGKGNVQFYLQPTSTCNKQHVCHMWHVCEPKKAISINFFKYG